MTYLCIPEESNYSKLSEGDLGVSPQIYALSPCHEVTVLHGFRKNLQ